MKCTKATQRNPKLNVRLLRRIQRHILQKPQRFFMEGIVGHGTPGTKIASDNETMQVIPECGTVACIAGWANLLTGATGEDEANIYRARRALGTPEPEYVWGPDLLFDLVAWPKSFLEQYKAAKRPARRAKIAAARIEHLITKGE